jgi:hypothetical protein
VTKGGLKVKGGPPVQLNNHLALPGGNYTLLDGARPTYPNRLGPFLIPVIASMRLRVVMSNVSMLVTVPNAKARVDSLYKLIAQKFQGKLPTDEVRVAEVRGGDCLLGRMDVIDEVLHEGDTIEALDYDVWYVDSVASYH